MSLVRFISLELRSCFSASCRVDDKAILSFSFICLANTSEAEDIWVKKDRYSAAYSIYIHKGAWPPATGLGSWVSGPVVVTDRIKTSPIVWSGNPGNQKKPMFETRNLAWICHLGGTEKSLSWKKSTPEPAFSLQPLGLGNNLWIWKSDNRVFRYLPKCKEISLFYSDVKMT